MRTILLTIAVSSLLAMGSFVGSGVAESVDSQSGLLDGKVFIGHVGPKGKEANGEDELVFQGGLLLSTSCIKYGFETAPYTASRQAERILFEAVILSPKHGRIEWRGHVTGDRAEAVYIWTKDRWYWFDAYEESWFRGRLKKE